MTKLPLFASVFVFISDIFTEERRLLTREHESEKSILTFVVNLWLVFMKKNLMLYFYRTSYSFIGLLCSTSRVYDRTLSSLSSCFTESRKLKMRLRTFLFTVRQSATSLTFTK